ncbi:restriction endonuclease subunit S [Porphyromonas endodontalis]|jgi:type I restriction-modification
MENKIKPIKVYRLRYVFELRNGYTPSKKDLSYWSGGTIPWFRMEDIRKNGRILSDSIQHITSKAVKGGGLFSANSFILATTATIGEHALLIADSLANQQFTNLKVRKSLMDKFDMKFLFYYMYKIGEWCKNSVNTTCFSSVNIDELKSQMIPLFTLSDQKAIAEYLDKATAEIDKAIAQQQHMIDLLNERKQIIIQRAVTKGMDENVEMKDSGVEWIGDIPAHWQVKKLKYIANTNSGSTPRNISGKGSPSSNIKWVRTTDLNNDIVTDTSEYLSKQEMASASCPLLEPNTVLISMYGGSRSFGKIGILGIEATINQALCSISANDDILPKYLFYYLQSVNKIWMKFAASSRKDPNLNQEIIRNIHIAYPQSKDEQDMVVGMLEKSIREVNNGISQYESLISTLQERKQIIISEVVTGKIKVS